MTKLRAGALDARNIGSTLTYKNEDLDIDVMGSVLAINKKGDTVQILLPGDGTMLTLERGEQVDITLSPLAFFQKEAADILEDIATQLQDLGDALDRRAREAIASAKEKAA